MNTKDVTVVVPCKGRLSHLMQTIPAMLRHSSIPIIVVDYACPSNTKAWVSSLHSPKCSSFSANVPGPFNLSRARNIGIKQVSTKYVISMDADCLVQDGLLESLVPQGDEVRLLVGVHQQGGVSYCRFTKSLWEKVRGYDESMEGWGYEDTDFLARLKQHTSVVKVPCNGRMSCLFHDNRVRAKHYEENNIYSSLERNKTISMTPRIVNPEGFGLV